MFIFNCVTTGIEAKASKNSYVADFPMARAGVSKRYEFGVVK